MQKDRRRYRRQGQDMHTIGFAIYEVRGHKGVMLLSRCISAVGDVSSVCSRSQIPEQVSCSSLFHFSGFF